MTFKLLMSVVTPHIKTMTERNYMDWLKEILGEELFGKLETSINDHNAKDENKDNQVKLANLSKGEYVSKDKYASLETDKGSIAEQLKTAQSLIEDLKKGTSKDETLQEKIGEYEGTITDLQAENEKLKKESALKIALLGAGVKQSDIEYLSFQMEKNGTEVKLDDNGSIKGMDDIITGLKTQFPSQFEPSSNKKIDENKLNEPDKKDAVTGEDFNKMSYQQRVDLFNKNPDAYNELAGHTIKE